MGRNERRYRMVQKTNGNIKDTIINEVEKGMSMRKASQKYKIPLSTVAKWCNDENIKSKHKRPKKKATDDEILDFIKKNLVCSVSDLEEHFDYHTNAIRKRLKKLLIKGKVDYIVLSGGGTKSAQIFKGYIDKRMYFIDQSDLQKWIEKQLPHEMPTALKRAVSQKLRDSGIPFEFKKNERKAVVINQKTYDKIRKEAQKKGKSMADYLEAKLK